jgi:hypothetical protein
MTRDGSIFDGGRTLPDGDRILDLAEPTLLHASMPGTADRSLRPKMLEQLLLQHSAGLDE